MTNLKQELYRFIGNPHFPCIGAKAALKKQVITTIIAKNVLSPEDDIDILTNLYHFINVWKKRKNILQTFAVIFEGPLGCSEEMFEKNLWLLLQRIHDLDNEIYEWDSNVSSDINSKAFSFSLGGLGFFVIGLHPHSSRKSRQFMRPTLIFNLHEQFEQLKRKGTFERMQKQIRKRDQSYSGCVNPMVHDFGHSSEALQYSGRVNQSTEPFSFIKRNKTTQPWTTITPCSGSAFILKKDELLVVKDEKGGQVADLFCFNEHNKEEFFSSGKSIDYNQKIFFSLEDKLYSNKSHVMLSIINDDVKKHDVLFAPCNKDTFRIIYGSKEETTGCYEHLVDALEPYSIEKNYISSTFNIFMNTILTPKGKTKIVPPLSKAGDKIIFKSHMDLIVGLTACAAPLSNNNVLKPISYKILRQNPTEHI